jgi:hypothetical protein
VDEKAVSHDIRVTVSYRMGDTLTVQLTVDNRSGATVVEVRYPQVPGLAKFRKEAGAEPARLMPPPASQSLNTPFNTAVFSYPGLNMGFMTAVNEAMNRGFYMGAHDETPRLKSWRYEQTGEGETADIAASLVHHPHLKSGQTFEGCPWVLAFRDGDWVEVGQIYRAWFLETFGLRPRANDWIRGKHFYQMIMMMLPEGNINYRFVDVPELAREGLKYGIDSLQLAGWQFGGHDNGYPYYEPDPRLGTWDDVEKAIRECHEMGVRVYFFANIHCAMLDIDWFKNELNRYVSYNEFGKTSWIGYWGMGTVGSRLAYTVPGMAFVDPGFPGVADPTAAYFRKLAELGADGLHIDKLFPNAIEYNPNIAELGHTPDESGWKGTLELIDRIGRECREVKPDFSMSFECNWDRMLTHGTATWWAGNMTVARRLFPELTETVGHYMPYDFFGINNALREGHVVMLSPHKFNRGMGFAPWRHMSEYVAEAKRIRDEYVDIIFLGERLYGNDVDFGGAQPSGGVQHAVWRDPASGRRAIVLTNTSRDAVPVSVKAFAGVERATVRIVSPFVEPVVVRLPYEVQVPGEQYALVLEDPGAEVTPTVPKAVEAVTEEPSVIANGDFETGDLAGWVGDPNWAVDDNSAGGWYSGWQGRRFAWSGKGGEPATGKLRSTPFVLDKEGVEVQVAGWSDEWGKTWNRWNYLTLNLEDGTELDRAYSPNSTTFTPMVLDGSGHRGERVYIEAVDDAGQPSFSMLCIDKVRTVDLLPALKVADGDPAERIRLEDDLYLVEVRKMNGAIARILDKKSGLDLILEPRLADNFAFALPIVAKEAWTNTEANRILGVSQRLTSHTLENGVLTLHWDGPLASIYGVFYDAAVTMTIALRGGQVEFGMTIDNRTSLEIGEVYYPIIGGTQGLGDKEYLRKNTIRTVPIGAATDAQRIYHTFANMTPFGELYPEQLFVYPHTLSMPWVHLFAPQLGRGVYFAAHDPVRRVTTVQLMLQPGTASNRFDGNWPRPDELDGIPAGISMNFVHMAYHPAGTPFTATPVVLRFHDGDAAVAAGFYGAWFKETFGGAPDVPRPALQDCERIAFTGLAEKARLAREAGKNALLLTDWKSGGQNNGIADFTPDPGLGGIQGLTEAAKACHDAGVALYLRFNLQTSNPDTEFHKEHMANFVSTDRWGVPLTVPGPRWVWLNPGSPALRERLVAQTAELAKAGVDGIFIDGFFTDKIDFNPAGNMTADRADWDGGMATLAGIRAACRSANPNFSLVTNAVRDHLTTLALPATLATPPDSLFGVAFPQWVEKAADN